MFNNFWTVYLFLDRGEGREKETKRNIDAGKKHQLVASHAPPTGDLAHNPGMCPDWESNSRPFGSQASSQTTEPHQPGLSNFWMNVIHFSIGKISSCLVFIVYWSRNWELWSVVKASGTRCDSRWSLCWKKLCTPRTEMKLGPEESINNSKNVFRARVIREGSGLTWERGDGHSVWKILWRGLQDRLVVPEEFTLCVGGWTGRLLKAPPPPG